MNLFCFACARVISLLSFSALGEGLASRWGQPTAYDKINTINTFNFIYRVQAGLCDSRSQLSESFRMIKLSESRKEQKMCPGKQEAKTGFPVSFIKFIV